MRERRAEQQKQERRLQQKEENIDRKTEAIEKKAEAQKKMGEASVLEMYLTALPEVVKNAAAPLAQTDKIVMYGDGNATKLVGDAMKSSNQSMEGINEATGIDMKAILSGFVGGKAAAAAQENKE